MVKNGLSVFGLLGGLGVCLPITANAASNIVNGSTTSDWNAVGVLLLCDEEMECQDFCSATLIEEEWLITAGHCIEAADDYIEQAAVYSIDITVFVGFGSSDSALTKAAEVDLSIAHPDMDLTGGAMPESDIGLMQLKNSIKDIDPMPVNKTPMNSSWVGNKLTFVGYGITADWEVDGGIKRFAEIPIAEVQSELVLSLDTVDGKNLCSGDSGGAALEPQGDGSYELLGVNSFVFGYSYYNAACVGGGSGVVRIDQFMTWIESYTGTLDTAAKSGSPDDETETETETDTGTETETGSETDTGTESDGLDTSGEDLDIDESTGSGEDGEGPVLSGEANCSQMSASSSMGWALPLFALIGMRRSRKS